MGPRHVVADFSGGYLSSDGGALLLRRDPLLAVAAGKADPLWLRNGAQEQQGVFTRPGHITSVSAPSRASTGAPKMSGSLNWRYLMAFFHANLRLGIIGRERFHYWGSLVWTFFSRPTLFPLAVTFSIYDYPNGLQ